MAELSLSNALLDGIILTHIIYPDDEDDDNHEPTDPEYPALVYSDPYKALNQTILFKPPSKKPTKTVFDTDQSVTSSPPRRVVHGIEKKKSWDNVITDFISKKKKSPLHVSVKKTGTLSRSRSWDALHKIKDEEETADGQIETFVYKPQMRKRSRFKKEHSPQRDSPSPQMEVPSDDRKSSKYVHNSEEFQNFDDHPIVSQLQTSVPPRQLFDEEAGLYEVPVSIYKQQEKPSKPPRTKRMSAPVEPKKSDDRRFSFTSQDIATPQTTKLEEMNSKYLDGELGLLKINVLAVHIPQKPVARKVSDVGYDSDDDEMLMKPVTKVTPKDGLFCALSINGKHSRYESSVQPLNPIQQASFWDQTEMEAIFYTTYSQQLFVMSRKVALSDLSPKREIHKSKTECIGVGILPISTLEAQEITAAQGNIDNWAEIGTRMTETNVTLEPHGSVLLKLSYTSLKPQVPVSCSGSVTIKSLSGIDCFRGGEPCWTCCTVDIDSENFGTTSSKLGMEDHLSEGWTSEPINFDANNNTSCRIQLWGFRQETEHWFGEVYIPLAMIFPYSKQIVHQDEVDGPLSLLGSFEREITMPVEPKGTIQLVFIISPLQDDDDNDLEETIKALEDSGLFKPEAIAQLRSEVGESDFESSMQLPSKFETVPEDSKENELTPSSSLTPQPSTVIAASGVYDHLSPLTLSTSSSTLARSLKNKKMTLRLLGSLRLQVPKSYNEQKHTINSDIADPYRELEILKVELKDVKAKLASSEFYREKAELQVKTLQEEVTMWKMKYKNKKKKK